MIFLVENVENDLKMNRIRRNYVKKVSGWLGF